jgi:uncharacterized protein YutE (UPF0331/DUF86 family)
MTEALNDNCDLSWQIAREYMRAMEMAAQAVDIMAQLAKELEERNKRDPGGLQRAMEAAGITDMDRLSFARFREIANWPLYTKVASGCLRLGAMANRRKEQE